MNNQPRNIFDESKNILYTDNLKEAVTISSNIFNELDESKKKLLLFNLNRIFDDAVRQIDEMNENFRENKLTDIGEEYFRDIESTKRIIGDFGPLIFGRLLSNGT